MTKERIERQISDRKEFEHTTDETRTVHEGDAKTPIEIRKTVVDFLITWEPRPKRPVDLLNVDA
jgi:hypothetical protein